MTIDREQIRRDAEKLIEVNPGQPVETQGYDELRFAHACLALLTELEELDQALDQAVSMANDNAAEIVTLEAKLAKVPALVEALQRLTNPMGEPRTEEAVLVQIEVSDIARKALAAWEAQ